MLLTFDHPEWDLNLARENLSFSGVVDEIVERYSRAKSALGIDPHTSEGLDMFSQTTKKFQLIKSSFESIEAGENTKISHTSQIPNNDALGFPSNGDLTDLIDDDTWMQDILVPWEYQSLV